MNFNKRADIASAFYIVIFIAVVGISLLLITNLNVRLFQGLNEELNVTKYNSTTGYATSVQFYNTYNSRIWDWAFFGIFMGCLIAIGLSAWAVRISPIFYWVYGALSLFVLITGVILSNLWQDLAANPEFATTITNFPITNSLLGTYFPMVVTGIIVIFMILLFGKPPERA